MAFQDNFDPGNGNALQACIATFLNLDSQSFSQNGGFIPNFIQSKEGYANAIKEWLEEYTEYTFKKIELPTSEELLKYHKVCIIRGKSPRGDFGHVVVGEIKSDSEFVETFDVHPSSIGLDKSSKYNWIGAFSLNKKHPCFSRLPLPLKGSDINERKESVSFSFPFDTIKKRQPTVIQSIIENNSYSDEIVSKLNSIIKTLQDENGKMSLDYLNISSPALNDWIIELAKYKNETVLTAPWWVVENWMYRKVLEAIGWFEENGVKKDPFYSQKMQSITSATESFLTTVLPLKSNEMDYENFHRVILRSLWGNRADLSLSSGKVEILDKGALSLIDDTLEVWNLLQRKKISSIVKVNLVCDNTGLEFFSDLFLVYILLLTNTVDVIRLHCKSAPVFVSDVCRFDVDISLDYLENVINNAQSKEMVSFIRLCIRNSRLIIYEESFYTSAHPFWRMPNYLTNIFADSTLTIIKGDANYRRLLGDLHWECDASFDSVVGSYFPSPLLCLRTLKSNLIVGLDIKIFSETLAIDKNFLINGKYGIMQFTGREK